MAGIANMVLGSGAAGVAWAAPIYAPKVLEPLPAMVHRYGLDNNAILIAGGVLVALGMTQMVLGWMGVALAALGRGHRTRDERVLDLVFLDLVAAMVAADRYVTETEIALIRAMCFKFRGVEPSVVKVKSVLRRRAASLARVLNDLRRQAKYIPEATKLQMVEAALWVSLSDVSRPEREAKVLGETADAVGLARERLAVICANVERAAEALAPGEAVPAELAASGFASSGQGYGRPSSSRSGSDSGGQSGSPHLREVPSAGVVSGLTAGSGVRADGQFDDHAEGHVRDTVSVESAGGVAQQGEAGLRARPDDGLVSQSEQVASPFARNPLVRPVAD